MNRLLAPIPIAIVFADLLYGFSLNILQGLNLQQSAPAAGGLAVTPDIAFNGLQIIANGGMVLMVCFGLWVLYRLNSTAARGLILPIGVFRTLGLLAVLAFSVPSLWEWFHAALALAGGQPVVNTASPRYLVTALCLPLVALICLARLFDWYRLHQRPSENELQDTV